MAGIPGSSWKGRVGKSRHPGETRKQLKGWSTSAPEEAKIGPKPSQDRPRRPPGEGKTRLKSIKIASCSQDGSRNALGEEKRRTVLVLQSFLGSVLEAKIEKNDVNILCHF